MRPSKETFTGLDEYMQSRCSLYWGFGGGGGI